MLTDHEGTATVTDHEVTPLLPAWLLPAWWSPLQRSTQRAPAVSGHRGSPAGAIGGVIGGGARSTCS